MTDNSSEKATLSQKGITSDIKVGNDTVRTTIRRTGGADDDGLTFTQVRVHKDSKDPKKSSIVVKNEATLGDGNNFELSSSTIGSKEYEIATLQESGASLGRITTRHEVSGRLEPKLYIAMPWEKTQKATVEIKGDLGIGEREFTIVLGKGGKDDKIWTTVDRNFTPRSRAADAVRMNVEQILDNDESKGGTARKKLLASGTPMPEQLRDHVSTPEKATWKDLPGGYGDKPPTQNVPDARPAPLKAK